MANRFKPIVALVITAGLFAAFHLSLHRFLGVFLIGLAATFVVWRSGSIFTGMLLHMINNGLATFLVNYPQYDYLHMMQLQYSLPQFAAGILVITFAVYLFNHKATKALTQAG